MSFFIEKEVECNFNFDYEKVAEAVVSASLEHESFSYETPGDFSFLSDENEDDFNPDTGEVMLGDIIISVDKVKEQALEYGHSEKREFAFLITHSMLHLFGYDHMEADEAAVMEEHQRKILDALGITR